MDEVNAHSTCNQETTTQQPDHIALSHTGVRLSFIVIKLLVGSRINMSSHSAG